MEEVTGGGAVTDRELSVLKSWTEDHRDLDGIYPFDKVFQALDQAAEGGAAAPEDLDRLENLLKNLADPVKNLGCHKKIETVRGMHVVVTGDFMYGSREEIYALIEAAGGVIDKGVKRATDYVVVGERGSGRWKAGRYGSKIEKALALKDQGLPVEIVEEGWFLPALKHMIERERTRE